MNTVTIARFIKAAEQPAYTAQQAAHLQALFNQESRRVPERAMQRVESQPPMSMPDDSVIMGMDPSRGYRSRSGGFGY